jgi:hypothetical protein
MRIFGKSRVTKTSASCRTSAAEAVDSAAMSGDAVIAVRSELRPELEITDLARTEELPIVRELRDLAAPDVINDDGNSDVFVCRRSSPDFDEEAAEAAAAAERVTLFVYGWENVEPGPLSWAFPSLRAALDAVRAMRNAVEWCIAATPPGREWTDLDDARAEGAVLIEQNA